MRSYCWTNKMQFRGLYSTTFDSIWLKGLRVCNCILHYVFWPLGCPFVCHCIVGLGNVVHLHMHLIALQGNNG